MTTEWFPTTTGLDIRELPEVGSTIRPSLTDEATYPVITEALFYRPFVSRHEREEELARHVAGRAREKGAATVFVSEPRDRELPQVFGEPHPMTVDGKLHQIYCYVAYVAPNPTEGDS